MGAICASTVMIASVHVSTYNTLSGIPVSHYTTNTDMCPRMPSHPFVFSSFECAVRVAAYGAHFQHLNANVRALMPVMIMSHSGGTAALCRVSGGGACKPADCCG